MFTSNLALVVVLALVVYRATRVMTVDTISEPWRTWLYRQMQEIGADKRSVIRYGYTLVTCGFCLSVWLSFITVVLYGWLVLDHWLGWEFPFAALAVAGAASLMIAVDHRLMVHD